jgi:uncharacterized membrane protein
MTQAIEERSIAAVGRDAAALGVADIRLPAIDRMRGLVILLMALDHVRDFFHSEALLFSATDLSKTYPLLFLTRFITHYCAPTFVFLAGASAFLHGTRLDDRWKLSQFLASRGLWLILLDVFVVSPVWALGSGKIWLGVLWAIGVAMIALSVLVFLPSRIVLLIGALILAGHNLLDRFHAVDFGAFAPLWSIIHEPGPLPWGIGGRVGYPVLAWIGVMAVGYGMGPIFLAPAARRDRILRLSGLACIGLFIVLRASNFYGDPHPWNAQSDNVTTALSILNVTKYPPSLLYALITLGPMLLLLPALERLHGAFGAITATFGRTPLFVYILHLYVALAAGMALRLAQGFDFQKLRNLGAQDSALEGYGANLFGVYLAWIVIMAALYPACRWFAGVKRRRRDWWLSYL